MSIIHLLEGRSFDFLNPDNSNYTIEDVARGLSRQPRFAGHSTVPYYVAQHAWLVSYVVPEHLALAGLCHDNSEAFLLDIPKPLKVLLPGYIELEHKVEESMFRRIGLEFPMDKEIKIADIVVFVTERRDLQPDAKLDKIYKNIKPLDEKIVPWNSNKCYNMWMKRYKQLGGKL
jgi:hypothetical protein